MLGYNFVVHVPRGASQLKVVQISDSGKHDSVFLGKEFKLYEYFLENTC